MGNNGSGFVNETLLRDYINSCSLFEFYNANIKSFLNDIFVFSLFGKKITCRKTGNQQKPDLIFICEGFERYVSVKKGSGNSVHQESLDSFVKFLEEIGVSEHTINSLKLYHYGDGTNDNSGKTRLSARECAIKYEPQVKQANQEFKEKVKLKAIIDRVLFEGIVSLGKEVDYIYYGTVEKGLWVSRKDLTHYFLNSTFSSNTIHFASLTYQVWGRNNAFTAAHPERRHVMQVKWSQIVTDLTKCVEFQNVKE